MEDSINADYLEGKKDLISSFNEAKFQIIRLHLLYQSCNTLSQSGSLDKWKWRLDSMWRELSPDAKEKDGYPGNEFKQWLEEGIKKEGTYIYTITKLNEEIANAKTDNAIYDALQKKEIFLRCLQDDVGKGSKRSSSDEDDIDE